MTSSSEINFKTVSGVALTPHLEALGQLRIQIFRDFPYLYDGNIDYEVKYLDRYVQSAGSLVVLAFDGPEKDRRIIGATTCLPMVDEDKEFQKPFLSADFDLSRMFYFGESILLSDFRGKKIGHAFFKYREEHACKVISNLEWTTFCAVQRPIDHPLRPDSYRDLHGFWKRSGYTPQPEFNTKYKWKDINQSDESEKEMVFWLKKWS